MPTNKHNLLLNRTFQYLGIILVMAAMGGGYWYWKNAQAGLNINTSQEGALSNGLVGYWPFDGNDISGTTAYDRSGQGNNGTLTNGPTKTIGKVGQSLAFGGSIAVNLGSDASLDNLGPVTFSAWIYPRSLGGGSLGKIITKDTNGSSGHIQFFVGGVGTSGTGCTSPMNVFYFQKQGTSTLGKCTTDNAISFNRWQHVVVTWDGSVSASNVHIYKDGIELGYNSGASNGSGLNSDDTLNYYVGNRGDGSRGFDGYIDEPRIYNRVLSPSEIQSLYELGNPDKMNSADSQGDTLEKGLVGYWKLDDASGTSATDSSGNGNTGTLTNGPTWTAGQIGGALALNGTNQYANATTTGVSAQTVSYWIQPTTANKYAMNLGSAYVNGNGLFSGPSATTYINGQPASVSLGSEGIGGSTFEGGSSAPWGGYDQNGGISTISAVSSGAYNGTYALKHSITSPGSSANDIQLKENHWTAVTAGQLYRIQFAAKASVAKSGLKAVLIQAESPYALLAAGEMTYNVGTSWNLYTFYVYATQTIGSAEVWFYNGGQGVFDIYYDDISFKPVTSVTPSVPTGSWTHVVNIISSPLSVSSVRIGSAMNSYSGGSFDEVRIYNRALSADEVAKLYKTTAPDNPDTGLIGYWPFDGKDISGTTAYDRSGKGNNGTLTNGPTKTIGRVGQGISFDGSDDQVSIPHSANYVFGSGSFSVGFWVKTSGYVNRGSGLNAIFSRGNWNGDYAVAIDSSNKPVFNRGGTSITGSTLINDNQWHYIVAGKNGTTLELYVDGVKDTATATDIGSSSGTNNLLLATDGLSSRLFSGSIDEPRIYNRALSTSEIWGLYQAGAADKVNSADTQSAPLERGLAGYWRFDDASGGSATDSSGNGMTGTLTNGPTWTTGRVDGAVDLDGADDYVSIADNAALDIGTGDFTYSFWLNPDDTTQGVFFSDGSYSDGIMFYRWTDTHNYVWLGNTYFSSTNWVPTASTWQHVTLRRKSGTVTMYADGIQKFSGTLSNSINSALGMRIGYGFAGAANVPVNGRIDEFRMYNRALSDDEIMTLVRLTRPDDPETGLVGYWSFDGKDISGTTAYDRSSKGNNGTLTNGPTKTIGKSGQAIDFDGADDYAFVADNTTLDFTASADFSISGWVYRDTSTTDDTILAKRNGIANTDDGYIAYIDDVDDKLHIEVSDNADTDEFELVSNSTFTTPGWNHIAVVWDDDSTANTEIYINGVADSATETGTQNNIGDLSNALTFRAGAESDNGNPFDGKLDEIRVYNRALTATEIKDQYNQGGRIGWICGNGTVTDQDNNIYGTIQIGTQCWMRQNMRVGTRIAASTNQTNNATIEKYCYSDSDANCTSANPNQPDGGLYQWDEAMQYSTTAGARGICPTGFHIPTDAEQYTLENYLKDAGQTCNASRSGTYDCSTAGTKLKPGGTSGFEGNLAGYAGAGSFVNRGTGGDFWSSSESGATAWNRYLHSAVATVFRDAYDKTSAFSVRCVKD